MSTIGPGAASGPEARGRILLVDDEPELRRLLRRSLARAGYEVAEASNGSAALQLARQSCFDLVISDVRMPLMNGLELLERLRCEEPGLPVVLISGSTELENRRSAIGRGAFDFLPKPISLIHLQAVAWSAIAQRDQASAEASCRDSHQRLRSAETVVADPALPSNWK